MPFDRLVLALPLLLASSEYRPRIVKAPTGHYLGFKQVGADPYGYQSLELTIDAKGGATLVWARRDQSEEKERKALPLTAIKLDAAGFSATVTGARPSEVPAKLVGKFVTQFPGPNQKGPVHDGILFPGDWFLEVKASE